MSCMSLVLIFVFGLTAFAEQATPVIKSWKVFRNDNGYELKYPDCWNAQINDPDQEGAVTTSKDVIFGELPPCRRPRFHKYVPNGISTSAWLNFNSRAEVVVEREGRAKLVMSGVRKNLGVARFKAGTDDAIMYVEVPSEGKIRWIAQIYCSKNFIIGTSGPTMDDSSAIYSEYIKRLKAGDLSPPEPEKTILESIRCTEPKAK
jgi:hypothetical protein